MLARSNHVKSKSDAVQSIDVGIGSQLMFHVSLVATATTSSTAGSCDARTGRGAASRPRTTSAAAVNDARSVPKVRIGDARYGVVR